MSENDFFDAVYIAAIAAGRSTGEAETIAYNAVAQRRNYRGE